MKIKFFLGSSIIEFENDRTAFENFISQLNQIYIKDPDDPDYDSSKDIRFVLEKCENMNDLVTKNGSQEVINERLKNCDFAFFLIGGNIGKYTAEEFEVALEKKESTKKPLIEAYVRVTTDTGDPIEQSEITKSFLNKYFLKDSKGIYFKNYVNKEKIFLDLMIHLYNLNINGMKITISGNKLKDGKNEILSLDKIPGWKNNEALIKAKEDLDKARAERDLFDERFVNGEISEEERDTVRDEYDNKVSSLNHLRNNVFELFCHLNKSLSTDMVTDKAIRAYKCLESGNIKEALLILDYKTIQQDIENDYKELELVKMTQKVLNEKNYKRLNVMITEAKAYSLQAITIEDYKALEVRYNTAMKYISDFDLKDDTDFNLLFANVYYQKGIIYQEDKMYDISIKEIHKSIHHYEKSNVVVHAKEIALAYLNTSFCFHELNQFDNALKENEKAKICLENAKSNDDESAYLKCRIYQAANRIHTRKITTNPDTKNELDKKTHPKVETRHTIQSINYINNFKK